MNGHIPPNVASPTPEIGLLQSRHFLHFLFVEARHRRTADDALHLRQRGGGGVGGIVRQRLPARAVRRVEPEGRREVVDPGFLRVGVVAVLALLEEALRHHLAGERGAILLFGDLVEVLAERVEASRARPYIPPTPRRAVESYWRQHPIRADKLARALAALSGAPEGWVWQISSGARHPRPP